MFRVPKPSFVAGIEDDLPYYLVGDEIFPLKSWLQRTYPGSLDESKQFFYYRLSRERRTIENAFSILINSWRIFRQLIRADVTTVESIVQACICLHNFLQLPSNTCYTPTGFVDRELSDETIKNGDWRNIVEADNTGLKKLPKRRGGRQLEEGKHLQSILKDYVNSERGAVAWQWDYVRRTGPP